MGGRDGKGSEDRLPVHLVVLQHGLWGIPHNMIALYELFQRKLPENADGERVVVVNSDVNQRRKTHEGVDVCGERLAEYILDATAKIELEGARVAKFSVLGYSLGGLMIRYAVGKLLVVGYFDRVRPMNFITMATPHLGNFRESEGLGVWARLANAHVPLIASRSGHQLMLLDRQYPLPGTAGQGAAPRMPTKMLSSCTEESVGAAKRAAEGGPDDGAGDPQEGADEDGQEGAGPKGHRRSKSLLQRLRAKSAAAKAAKAAAAAAAAADGPRLAPLLVVMAHPAGPFLAGLARFKNRIRVANIKYDVSVPYTTAAMTLTNPYETNPAMSIHPQYPSVMRLAAPDECSGTEGKAGARMDGGMVTALALSPLAAPVIPFLYLGYITSTAVHSRIAAKKAPDARWIAEAKVFARASALVARLSAAVGALTGQPPAVVAGAPADVARCDSGGASDLMVRRDLRRTASMMAAAAAAVAAADGVVEGDGNGAAGPQSPRGNGGPAGVALRPSVMGGNGAAPALSRMPSLPARRSGMGRSLSASRRATSLAARAPAPPTVIEGQPVVAIVSADSTDNHPNPFASFQRPVMADIGGGKAGQAAAVDDDDEDVSPFATPTSQEEGATFAVEGSAAPGIGEAGSGPKPEGAASAEVPNWKRGLVPAWASLPPPPERGANGGSGGRGGAAYNGTSSSEEEGAQLLRALDSVAETQRRALLAGTVAMRESTGGVLEGGFGEQQAWMAKQLTKLTWVAVDADCGITRSHAAVINRDKAFGKVARTDVMDYVADHMIM